MSEECKAEIRRIEDRVGDHREKLAQHATLIGGHADRLKELDAKKVDAADYAWMKRIFMAVAMTGISGWLAWFGKLFLRGP